MILSATLIEKERERKNVRMQMKVYNEEKTQVAQVTYEC